MADIVAMILAGGRVDDLGVLTLGRPKSVLPFGGLYRVIDFPLSNLVNSGIEVVGILSQYKPFHLISHIANGRPWDLVGRNRAAVILPPFKGQGYSDWYRGTADAVYQNLDFLRLHRPEWVLVLSGDHIYGMDYRQLCRFHMDKKADLTVAFAQVPREGAHRFGLALIDDEEPRGGRVLRYVEKPKDPPFEWASLTIYLFNASVLLDVLSEASARKSYEFGKDILPALVPRNRVYGYKHRGYWGYTRTPEEYFETSMSLLEPGGTVDPVAWKVRTNLSDRNIGDRQPALVGKSASVRNALIYNGCVVEGTVRNSILFPGVQVAKGAVVADSIIFYDTVVAAEARVTGAVIDEDTVIGPGTMIGEQGTRNLTIVGQGVHIPAATIIAGGVTVHPNLEEADFARKAYGAGETII